jgi:5-dehydro-2-deoxygluconokinase
VLDIDYRPVLWGLTGKADGETRFIASEASPRICSACCLLFDLVIGTEEEFRIAGGGDRSDRCLAQGPRGHPRDACRQARALGCRSSTARYPRQLDAAPTFEGVPRSKSQRARRRRCVRGRLPVGLVARRTLRGLRARCERERRAGRFAPCVRACDADAGRARLLSARCASRSESMRRPDRDVTLARLHRVTVPRTQWDEFLVSHSITATRCSSSRSETGCRRSAYRALKGLFVEAVAQTEKARGNDDKGHIGVLIDGRLWRRRTRRRNRSRLVDRSANRAARFGRPSVFEGGRSIGTTLLDWPREHTIKCLVHYHPDEPFEPGSNKRPSFARSMTRRRRADTNCCSK